MTKKKKKKKKKKKPFRHLSLSPSHINSTTSRWYTQTLKVARVSSWLRCLYSFLRCDCMGYTCGLSSHASRARIHPSISFCESDCATSCLSSSRRSRVAFPSSLFARCVYNCAADNHPPRGNAKRRGAKAGQENWKEYYTVYIVYTLPYVRSDIEMPASTLHSDRPALVFIAVILSIKITPYVNSSQFKLLPRFYYSPNILRNSISFTSFQWQLYYRFTIFRWKSYWSFGYSEYSMIRKGN